MSLTKDQQELIDTWRGDSRTNFNHSAEMFRETLWCRNQFRNHLINVLLPELLVDMETNKFRIAAVLSTLDSRKLDEHTRNTLGLSPTFKRGLSKIYQPPRRALVTMLGYPQCSAAESALLDNFEVLENRILKVGMLPEYYQVSVEFFGCLAGKGNGYMSGLCFETTEFNNGYVMLRDVWYLASQTKDYEQYYKRLTRFEKQAYKMRTDHQEKNTLDTYDYSSLYEEGAEDPVITPAMVHWDNPGGIWIPTRSIYQDSMNMS